MESPNQTQIGNPTHPLPNHPSQITAPMHIFVNFAEVQVASSAERGRAEQGSSLGVAGLVVAGLADQRVVASLNREHAAS